MGPFFGGTARFFLAPSPYFLLKMRQDCGTIQGVRDVDDGRRRGGRRRRGLVGLGGLAPLEHRRSGA